MMDKFWLLLISIFALYLKETYGNPAPSPSNEENGNSVAVQALVAQLTRLKESLDQDALLTFFTSMVDEISRLTNKNQEYEARLNQLEATQGLTSRSQEEQYILPSPSNEIKQSKTMPSHCEDVRASGNLASGFYTVKGLTGKTIESIYCDFTFLPGAAGYETRIGYNDIKTSPVYFYVQRNTALSTIGVVTFIDVNRLNIGGAMDPETGVFTAPRPGTYFFTFTALHGEDGNYNKPFKVEIQLNGAAVGAAYNWISGSSSDDIPATVQSTLKLQANDQIRLYMRNGVLVEFSGSHDTHFTGMLLEEELSL